MANSSKTSRCYNCFQEIPEGEGSCPYCGFDLGENQADYPTALPAGTVLNGRYIIGRVLGQGGFGITYLALDTQLNAKVAVKEFMPNEIATRVGTTVSVAMKSRAEDFTYGAERFMEEARTLAKFMGHPNIAGVSSYFDENDTSYFVMDYIEGISFKTYIASRGGKVSVEDACNVMIPVLRALTAVHAEGFIHRDVTPDNIYITKDGIVKLLDFGSARYSIGDKSKSLDVILKVGYAPKEQYIRRSRQGPFTDVYSCAACFYAAITGFLPPESLERMDQDTLVPISQQGIEIPEYLDKAILKGLAVQPEDRFQSAAEFLEAIETQQVVEVPGKAPAAPEAPAKKKLPIPLIVGGIAAAVVLIFILGSLFGGRGGEENSSPAGQEMEEEEPGLPPLIASPVETVMIAGQEYSTDERYLDLNGVKLEPSDLEQLPYMVNLVGLYLEFPDLYDTPDLSFVSNMPNLQEFYLNGEFAGYDPLDLSPFKDLTHLQELMVGGSNGTKGVEDLSFLTNLSELQALKLTISPDVKDLSPLSGLSQINEMQLYGNFPTENIRFLSELKELESLEIWVEGLEDLSGLEQLPCLQSLSLNFTTNTVDTIDWLGECTSLQKLEVQILNKSEENMALSLEPIGNLTNLQELNFFVQNYITADDLSPFSDLVELRQMSLTVMTFEEGRYAVRFSDLSPLGSLKKLEKLLIHPVDGSVDSSCVAHVRELSLIPG